MAYGLFVKNDSSRVQIDSETGYPTLYQSTSGTVATLNFNTVGTDSMVFARPVATTGNSYIARDINGVLGSGSATLQYRVFKEVTSGLVVPTTGYGLNIYGGSPSTQLIFSATSSSYVNNLEIIATGRFGFNPDTELDIPMPSSTYDLSTGNVFVLANTIVNIGNDQTSSFYYEYRFDDSEFGTIRLYANTIFVNVGGPPDFFVQVTSIPASSGNAYVIAYIRS